MSRTSQALSIIALFTGCIPVAGALIAIPCGSIGALMSIAAGRQRETMIAPGLTVPRKNNDDTATAGFITGIAGIIISLAWLVTFMAFAGKTLQNFVQMPGY